MRSRKLLRFAGDLAEVVDGFSRRTWTAVIALAAFAVRAPLMLRRHEITAGGDSLGYVQLATSFFDQGDAAGYLSATRPPGYPLFLLAADQLPGRLEDAAITAQLVLGVALCAAIVHFTWPLLGRGTAVTAGLLAALTAPLLLIESQLLADYLFGFLAVTGAGVLIAACLAHGRRRTMLLVGTGVVFAIATYVKPVGQALVLAPVLPLAFATRSLKSTVAGSLLVAAVLIGAILPWMLRNEAKYDEFTMSARSGRTLVNRVFEDDKLPIPSDLPAGRVAREIQLRDPQVRLSSGLFNELTRRGASPQDAEDMQRELAVTAIKRSPGRFAIGTARSIANMFGDVAGDRGRPELELFIAQRRSLVPRRVTLFGLAVVDPLRRVWELLALGGLVALAWLVLTRERHARVAIAGCLGVWLSVAVATAVLHGGQFRYAAALSPLVWLLGSVGLVWAIRLGVYLLRDPSRRVATLDAIRSGTSPARRDRAEPGGREQPVNE